MTIGVMIVIFITDQTVRLAHFQQVIHGVLDVLSVLPARRGRTFCQQSVSGEGCHGHPVLSTIGLPVSLATLFPGEVFQCIGNRLLEFRVTVFGRNTI